jgi:putative transposase
MTLAQTLSPEGNRRSPHYTITAHQVHQLTSQHLQGSLHLADHGPKTRATRLFTILLWAAAHLTSVTAACQALRDAPSDQAVRDALLATLPQFAQLQRRRNHALRRGLPRPLRRRRQRRALDLTLLPYYGQPESDPAELYKGARKAGTRRFHGYATAYVIFKGCRWTLALRAGHHSDPWDDIVTDLLRQVALAGVRGRLVLLDRGFYSVDVIRYLQAARYPFLMPVMRRGRPADHPEGPSGTRVFFTWRRSGWSRYTLESKGGRRATVNSCVCCRPPLPPQPGSRRTPPRRVWVYAYWGVQPGSGSWVRLKTACCTLAS